MSLHSASLRLRPYQETCVRQVIDKWSEYRRLLAVLPTGAGKTIIFSHIAATVPGKVLILAHREELLQQAIKKLRMATGLDASLERAESKGSRTGKAVVASIQTMCRRFHDYSPDHFSHVIVDEAHHIAASTYQGVLNYFSSACVLGVTATPDRSDKQALGQWFEDLAFEVTLADLIKGGYLSPIRARVCDVSIDLTKVRVQTGDFDAGDSGEALEPYLERIADQILEHGGNKTLVFLPLIATSKRMRDIMSAKGFNVRHVDGTSEDRAEILEWFAKEPKAALCNAMLLTEGYDEPSIDTIVCLRPTKSRALYTQMIGRGTRLSPGKGNLTILDFLWLTGKHRLIRPTSLFAEGEVAELADKATQEQREFDLQEAVEAATAEREAALARELAKKKRSSGKFIDPVEYALGVHDVKLQDYAPTMAWHSEPMTDKQIRMLSAYGFDIHRIADRGQASALIDSLIGRTAKRLATFKQVRLLKRFGHHKAETYSFEQASRLINQICKPSSQSTLAKVAA